MPLLRTSEIVSLAYFACIAALAWRKRVSSRARVRSAFTLAGVALAIVVVARAASQDAAAYPGTVARDWLPGLLLLLAYWAPGDLVRGTHAGLERSLLDMDRHLFASTAGRALSAPTRPVRELLEAGYLAVYPMVPVTFVLLLVAGHEAHVDYFWTIILTSEYVCYVLLPLLPSRPPRHLEPQPAYGGAPVSVRRLNLWMLDLGSVQWNTFPSGHVAGAVACALAVLPLLPAVGIVLLVLAVLIALASVAGRYHYAADAVAGAAVAVAVFTVFG